MKAKHFSIEELAHPDIVAQFGEKAWMFIRPEAIEALDALRERFGPITVNNYKWGGPRTSSGLRPLVGGVGAPASLHRYGCAFDCVFHKTDPVTVFDHILDNPGAFPAIRRLENARSTKTWLHFDVANTGNPGIIVFEP